MKTTTALFLAVILAFASCDNAIEKPIEPDKPMETNAHRDSIVQFIRAYIGEIWNQSDFTNADKYWGPEFRNVFAPGLPHGPEAMKQQVAYFLDAFDDIHFELKDIMVDGEKVSMWIEISGVHTGEFFGIPPTGKEVKFREAVWYTLKDGKLDEVYPFVDWNMLFEQLGRYPALGGG